MGVEQNRKDSFLPRRRGSTIWTGSFFNSSSSSSLWLLLLLSLIFVFNFCFGHTEKKLFRVAFRQSLSSRLPQDLPRQKKKKKTHLHEKIFGKKKKKKKK